MKVVTEHMGAAVADDPTIKLKDLAVDTVTGAAIGAAVGGGIVESPVGLFALGSVGGSANYAVKETLNDDWGNHSVGGHLLSGGADALSWGIATVLGGNMKNTLSGYTKMMLVGTTNQIPTGFGMTIGNAVGDEFGKRIFGQEMFMFKQDVLDLGVQAFKSALKSNIISTIISAIFSRGVKNCEEE